MFLYKFLLYSSLLLFLLVYFLLSLPFLSSLCLLFPEFVFSLLLILHVDFKFLLSLLTFSSVLPQVNFSGGGFPHNVQIRPGTRLNPLFVIPTCRFQISTFSAYFLSCAHTSKFSSFFFPKCSDPPGNSRGPRPGLGLQEAGQRRGLPRNHHICP